MNFRLLFLCFFVYFKGNTQNPVTNGSDWSVSNLTAQNALDFPYTILNGPNNSLWVTEREGKKLVKVDKSSGNISTILDLASETPAVHQSKGQDGLLGMAIHPDLLADITTTINNFVYLAYTYDIDTSDDNDDNTEDDVDRKLRIVRYTYNNSLEMFDDNSDFEIISGLDASNDHNSGKLVIGPDLKLYYSIGDQGANQFGNACNPIRSQDLPTSVTDFGTYKGKILRFNLDGTIPNDNPTFNSVQSHVYSYGHRNAQGIVFGSNGKLYSSEHGGKVDDEINIIEASKNYGWPEIAGGYDNNGYTYCNWASTPGGCSSNGFSNHNCPSNVTAMTEFASHPTMPSDFMAPIGTYGSTSTSEPTGGWLSWPTVAPSSISIYEGGVIPNWGTSLLIPTLKRGTIFRVKLDVTGNAIDGNPTLMDDSVYEEWHSSNDRYRDIVADQDGVTFWAITDNSGGTSGPSGSSNVGVTNKGVVMKIEFVGQTLSNNILESDSIIALHPNPATESFNISFDDNIYETIDLEIIDMSGRIVKKIDKIHNEENILLNELKSGLFIVYILKNNIKIDSKKLIIN